MFILEADQPPTTTSELVRAITASLNRSIKFSADNERVKIAGEPPDLESIAIDISDGDVISSQSLTDRKQETVPWPTIGFVTILGDPIRVAQIPVHLSLAAKDVRLNYGRSEAGQIVAMPDSASDGRLTIKLAQSELDTALLLLARKFSAKQGVEILEVHCTLNAISRTELNILIKITVKKFMTAMIDIAGHVQIDDRMRVTASNLKASSSGMVGNVAVGFLQAQLNKLEGRPLPLLKFSLGSLQLQGVCVDTTDGLALTASFGSEPE